MAVRNFPVPAGWGIRPLSFLRQSEEDSYFFGLPRDIREYCLAPYLNYTVCLEPCGERWITPQLVQSEKYLVEDMRPGQPFELNLLPNGDFLFSHSGLQRYCPQTGEWIQLTEKRIYADEEEVGLEYRYYLEWDRLILVEDSTFWIFEQFSTLPASQSALAFQQAWDVLEPIICDCPYGLYLDLEMNHPKYEPLAKKLNNSLPNGQRISGYHIIGYHTPTYYGGYLLRFKTDKRDLGEVWDFQHYLEIWRVIQ